MSQWVRQFNKSFEVSLVISTLIAGVLLLVATRAFAADMMINGAGATFPDAIYTKWFSEYRKVDPQITINYQGIGSGGGIRQLIAGTVDFGASDAPMTEEEMKSAGKTVVHVPTVLGAVVVSYNLKLAKPLKLNAAVLSQIFLGKINKWNDPQITALNTGSELPNQAIIVATRSDGSGTTAIFTDYLSKVSTDWKGKAGKTVDWFKGSVAAKGNAGVAGLVKQNEGTIGYIELIYAVENKLPYALIQNKAGQFVEANLKSVSAAAEKSVGEMTKNDFKLSITNADGKAAYPISSFTWLLINDPMPKDRGQKIVQFLNWSLSNAGQKMAQEMNYSELPKSLRDKVLARVKTIQLK